MGISRREFDALLAAVLKFYAFPDKIAFERQAPAIILWIVRARRFLLLGSRSDADTGHVVLMEFGDSPPRAEASFVKPRARTDGDWGGRVPGVHRLSGSSHRSRLNGSTVQSARDSEATSPSLGLEMTTGRGYVVLCLVRSPLQRNFTDRDRQVLALLGPHFYLAWRSLQQPAVRRLACRKAIGPPGLTQRQLQVAGWLAKGKTNREISVILDMGIRTVEKHVESVLLKLGVENRTAAAVALVRMGEG